MPRRGRGNPRQGICVRTRWGWGPSASARKSGGSGGWGPGATEKSHSGRSMRVIAGTLKGRRLKAPTWDGLRPTSDKLRETLFNVLAPKIAGARVLDAFAGTGALGIEALSR